MKSLGRHLPQAIQSLWSFFEISPWLLGAFALISVVVGLSEATVVALIVQAAAALASHQGSVDLNTKIFDLGQVSVAGLLVVAFIAVAFRGGCQLMAIWVPVKLGTEAATRLRQRCLAAYLRSRWDVQAGVRQGGLVDLLTNQTEFASEFVTATATATGAGLTFATLAVAAAAISPFAFAGVLVVGCVLFFVLRPITKVGQRRARAFSKASERFATHVDTIVGMAEEVRTFGVGEQVQSLAGGFIGDVRRQRAGMDITGRLIWISYQNITMVAMVLVLFGLRLFPGVDFAALGAVVLILMRALSGGQDLQSQYNLARQRLPFVDKVRSLISDLERDRAPAGICSLAEVEDIELRDVHFSYVQSRPVLTGASAAIRPGELVAIVGPSGAGKSTLLQILLRLRYPDGGQYLIGRQPASSFLDADWARRVACVPQDSRVLHASVADNIRFFRDIPEGQVLAAARAAQIDHDILALPEGYETLVGQRMDALSGGQRQRLCLARALAGQPQLLILDEPTSALDDASERLVHEALAQLRGRVTTIVVAHRPGILSVCDRVLTLDGGTLHARPHVPTAFATMAPDGAIL